MTALYKIANQYAELSNSDMDAEMIADTLEGIEGEFEDKLENIMGAIKNLEAESEMLKTESKNLAERAKSAQNKADSMKQYIIKSLMTMDKKSMSAGVHKVTVVKPRASVDIIDANKLPAEFVEYKTTVQPDKKLIMDKLKLGEEVSGAQIKIGNPTLKVS